MKGESSSGFHRLFSRLHLALVQSRQRSGSGSSHLLQTKQVVIGLEAVVFAAPDAFCASNRRADRTRPVEMQAARKLDFVADSEDAATITADELLRVIDREAGQQILRLVGIAEFVGKGPPAVQKCRFLIGAVGPARAGDVGHPFDLRWANVTGVRMGHDHS